RQRVPNGGRRRVRRTRGLGGRVGERGGRGQQRRSAGRSGRRRGRDAGEQASRGERRGGAGCPASRDAFVGPRRRRLVQGAALRFRGGLGGVFAFVGPRVGGVGCRPRLARDGEEAGDQRAGGCVPLGQGRGSGILGLGDQARQPGSLGARGGQPERLGGSPPALDGGRGRPGRGDELVAGSLGGGEA